MIQKRSKRVWSVFKATAKRYIDHRVGREAAELTYYILFSLFPIMIFLNSVISGMGYSAAVIFDRIRLVIPDDVVDFVMEYLDFVGSIDNRKMMYFGSVAAVYVLFNVVTSLSHAVRKAEGKESPHGLPRAIVSLIISFALMALIIVLLVVFSISNRIYDYIELFFGFETWVNWLGNLIRFAAGPLIFFLLLTLYYFIMGRKGEKIKNFMPGALLVSIVWYIFSMLFVLYVNNWANYGTLYGSLASIIVLLVWLHTTGIMLIVGAEFNYAIRDTRRISAAKIDSVKVPPAQIVEDAVLDDVPPASENADKNKMQ